LAILEKEVWVVLGGRNLDYYEKLGYEIPEIRGKHTTILVKIEDLPKGSHVKLTKICDVCKKIIPDQTFDNIVRGRGNFDGKDRCNNCVLVMNAKIKKENPPYEKSFEYHALNNRKEYMLSEFSEKNFRNPKNISYGSAEPFLWVCSTCKGEYPMSVIDRIRGRNCSYCTGKKVLMGYNDLWTTHPYVAKLLKHRQLGHEILAGRNQNEDFKCELW
jgi:hypothetical protein